MAAQRSFLYKRKTYYLLVLCICLEASVFTFYNYYDLESVEEELGKDALKSETHFTKYRKRTDWDEGNALYRGVNFSSVQCTVPKDIRFPICEYKIRYMQSFWKDHSCYHDNGLDGSLCSSLYYLSEVEHECPSVQWDEDTSRKLLNKRRNQRAELRTDLDGLYALMKDEYRYDWMKMRLKKSWKSWVKAAKELQLKESFRNRKKRRVYVYMGFLQTSLIDFGREAFKGGPLGELVQWTDLIASLYILGHDLTVSVDYGNTSMFLYDSASLCPNDARDPDLFFVDINGIRMIEFVGIHSSWPRYRCKIRMIDTFGTEPSYNHPDSSKPDNPWGKLGFNPKQFMTMFPHSPDNSFIGFVVGEPVDPEVKVKKKQKALVYSKLKSYLKFRRGVRPLLDYISLFYQVHGNLYDFGQTKDFNHPHSNDSFIPDYFINHGLLNQTELAEVLDETKLFIGVGFPFEGPAPLEAIAHGAVFIQPKFDPPLNRLNDIFFDSKPTERMVTSQNPYCEDFVGKPHVYTVDIENFDEVLKTVDEIRKHDLVDPYLPYEFTFKGMLERVWAHVENEDICSGKQWPPLNALRFSISDRGESCKDNCKRRGLICEPAFFHHINKKAILKELMRESPHRCQTSYLVDTYIAPALQVKTNDCYLQTDWLKFSCVDGDIDYKRFCPCREFIPGQVALCPGCLEEHRTQEHRTLEQSRSATLDADGQL